MLTEQFADCPSVPLSAPPGAWPAGGGVGVRAAGLASHSAAVLGRLESSNGFLSTPANYDKVLREQVLLGVGLTR